MLATPKSHPLITSPENTSRRKINHRHFRTFFCQSCIHYRTIFIESTPALHKQDTVLLVNVVLQWIAIYHSLWRIRLTVSLWQDHFKKTKNKNSTFTKRKFKALPTFPTRVKLGSILGQNSNVVNRHTITLQRSFFSLAFFQNLQENYITMNSIYCKRKVCCSIKT